MPRNTDRKTCLQAFRWIQALLVVVTLHFVLSAGVQAATFPAKDCDVASTRAQIEVTIITSGGPVFYSTFATGGSPAVDTGTVVGRSNPFEEDADDIKHCSNLPAQQCFTDAQCPTGAAGLCVGESALLSQAVCTGSCPECVIGLGRSAFEPNITCWPFKACSSNHSVGCLVDADCAAVSGGGVCTFVIPQPGPETREIHTEMISLDMCGKTGVPDTTHTICYKAGRPALTALKQLGAEGNWRESLGEVHSLNPNGANHGLDLPANSFFNMRGVVTISPVPPGTSGVFYTNAPILMMRNNITTLPPSPSGLSEVNVYQPGPGMTVEGGGGIACGQLPVALFDASDGTQKGTFDNTANIRHIHNYRIPDDPCRNVETCDTDVVYAPSLNLPNEHLTLSGTSTFVPGSGNPPTTGTFSDFSQSGNSRSLNGLVKIGLASDAIKNGPPSAGTFTNYIKHCSNATSTVCTTDANCPTGAAGLCVVDQPWLQHNNLRLAITMPNTIPGVLVSDNPIQVEATRDAPDTPATFSQVNGSVDFYMLGDPTKTTKVTLSNASIAVSRDVSADAVAASAVPTLSEWGMILLVVLLFGILTFLLMKRNRQVVRS